MTTSTRVALLGATGFIGSAVLRELATRPLRIRAVARSRAVVPADPVADVEVHPVDLTRPGGVAAAVADADVVVHCVAYIGGTATWRVADGDADAERVTVGLVHDLVAALRERPGPPARVVFVGAVSQVGPPGVEVLDERRPDRPAGEYDRQKLAAETALLDAHREGVLLATSVRLPTVYGTGPRSTARDKGVVSMMVRRAAAGEAITMWHDGTVRRDLLHVDDAARGVVAAVEHVDDLAGRAWLLGTGTGSPLGEVFRTVATMVADRTGTDPVDVVSVTPPEHSETADFHSFTVDSSAFRGRTGWSPAVTLEDGLHETVATTCAAATRPVGAAPEGERP